MTSPQAAALKTATEKRILNEFNTKMLNEERMDTVVESRDKSSGSAHTDMKFNCECDNKACGEIIVMSMEEYRQVHDKTSQFVVVPSHVRLDIEEIVASFSTYALVEKGFPHPNVKSPKGI